MSFYSVVNSKVLPFYTGRNDMNMSFYTARNGERLSFTTSGNDMIVSFLQWKFWNSYARIKQSKTWIHQTMAYQCWRWRWKRTYQHRNGGRERRTLKPTRLLIWWWWRQLLDAMATTTMKARWWRLQSAEVMVGQVVTEVRNKLQIGCEEWKCVECSFVCEDKRGEWKINWFLLNKFMLFLKLLKVNM